MKVLERTYSGLCGPMKIVIAGGTSFFVTFIDDAFRKVLAYTMKTWDEVLEYFKRFHDLIERETCTKLKYLRMNNRGEYNLWIKNIIKDLDIKKKILLSIVIVKVLFI